MSYIYNKLLLFSIEIIKPNMNFNSRLLYHESNLKTKILSLGLFLLMIVYSPASFAQVVHIIDSKTLSPIPGAIISDSAKNHYILTNDMGEASISSFKKFEYIYIQHNYYKKIKLKMDTLTSKSYTIKLKELIFQLNGLTITANKWEQRRDEIPFTITEMNSKEVDFNNPQSTPDLLGNTGTVFIQKSQLGGGSPMIRGFSANSILIVVDGVRMNNAIFRSGNLQNTLNIDPNSLGHSEIIFGPGSVSYGSDALGGVIDFNTKAVSFSTSDKFQVAAEGVYRISSADRENTLSFDIDLKWKKFGSHTQFLSSSFSNLMAGTKHYGAYPNFGKRNFFVDPKPDAKDSMLIIKNTNMMIPSYYNIRNINQKFRYQPNKNIDITYSFIYSTTSNIPRYDRLTQWKNNHLKYARWYYGPQDWIMNNFRIRLFKPTKIYDSGKIIIANQYFLESRNDRKYQSPIFRHRTEKVNMYTATIDFSKRLKKHTSLYYGIDLSFNNVHSQAYSKNIITNKTTVIQSRYPDKLNHYFSSGIFFNLKHQLTKKLYLLAGIRYSMIYLHSSFNSNRNGLPFSDIKLINQAPNGSIGIAWLAKSNTKVNFNLASGFRAPNIDDIAKIFDSEPGNVVVPNPNLKPEYAYSSEISIIRSINNFAQIEILGFSTFLNNIIVRKDFLYNGHDSIYYDGSYSKVQAMQNTNYAYIYGTSLSLKLNITKSIQLSSTYNITRGIDSDNNHLRHVPPDFGTTKLNFSNKSISSSFFINYSSCISFKNLAPAEQNKTNLYSPAGSPSWYTINWIADIKVYSNIHINLAVQNILDRFYIPYSSGIPAPGRNYLIGLRFYPF